MTSKGGEIIRAEYSVPEFHADHNVYILGAGYSAAAGLPLMSNFLEKMREFRSGLDASDPRSAPIDAVLRMNLEAGKAARRINLDLDNIEVLLSLSASSDPIKPDKTLSPFLLPTNIIAKAISATLEHYQDQYREICNENTFNAADRSYPIYDFMALVMAGKLGKLTSNIGQRNTIITFNYDTLVEQSLEAHNIKYSYGIHQPNAKNLSWYVAEDQADEGIVRILKLHGSINLCAHSVYDRYSSMTLEPGPDGKSQAPLVMPPWWKKDPSRELQAVWLKSLDRLKTATRIISIGYSCPPGDPYIKYLLASGLQDNISLSSVYVVNIDPAAQATTRSLFTDTFTSFKEIPPMPAESFFKGTSMTGYRTNSWLSDINRETR